MKRKLMIAVLAVVAVAPWTLLVGTIYLLHRQDVQVVLTRLRQDVYLTHGTPVLLLRTHGCKAPASNTQATLVLNGTLVFPDGESCPCSVTPWTAREDWGVVRTASQPGLFPRPGANLPS